jgi:hypothetical protein
MNEPVEPERPSLGNTLFMSGICGVIGLCVLLIGLGVIPSNDPNPSGAARLMTAGAGMIFILGSLMVLVRDLSGARNNEDIPANAPLILRLGGSLISIAMIALFALVCSVIAFGPFFPGGALPDLTRQMGTAGAAIFRTIMGGLGLAFWYIVIHLVLAKFRGTRARPK